MKDEAGDWMLIRLNRCDLRTPGECLCLGESGLPHWSFMEPSLQPVGF